MIQKKFLEITQMQQVTSEGDKLSALTQRSFLVCAYGGLIEPISSGQEEE